MPHSINEIKGDFTDILAATRQLQKLGFVYKRMHFDELKGQDPTDWTFSKSHLQRFQELVEDASAIRTQKKAWETRAQEWGISTPEASQQASKPKQAESQASSPRKR
ncbi:MAG: hypothetical protein M3Z49_01515 [Bifidobacteriales bacterium]|nr:hypothetical protein [Bifidobacteriales bacterium]